VETRRKSSSCANDVTEKIATVTETQFTHCRVV